MTLSDGRFRTDGTTIEPCCEKQEYMLNLERPYVRIRRSGSACVYNKDIFLQNIPKTKVKCDYCGAKLEYVPDLGKVSP